MPGAVGPCGPTAAEPGRTSPWWSSAAVSPDSSPVSGCREAGHPLHHRREERRVSGARGWENSYPGARVDVGNHFYCYSFEPSDALDRVLRPASPSCRRYFQVGDGQARHRAPRPLRRPRYWGRDLGRGGRPRGRSTSVVPQQGRGGVELVTARGRDLGRGPAQTDPTSPAIEGARHASPAPRSTRPGGTIRRRPGRPAGGHDRCRGQRVPDRPDHRPRGRPPRPCSSARPSGCSPTRTTTPTVGTGRAVGPAVISPSTAAGTAS